MEEEGLTHTSSVMAPERSREEESFTVIELELPLNDRAPPYLPVVKEAPVMLPVLLLPERSVATDPLPSLNPYAATSPPPTG